MWSNDQVIPERILGTITEISSNVNGSVDLVVVWSDPQIIGKFDVVIDVDGDGIYNTEFDVLDDNDVEITAGFVIPEFQFWIIAHLVLTATLAVCNLQKNNRIILLTAQINKNARA